jgi:hypothetical protein
VAAKEVFAVPQDTGVEQPIVDGSAKLGITEVWPGTVRQQVLGDLETAVLAGICLSL